ncbi:MAG: selenocysteine-specific translation elongation factor [Candidatus Latescibacteria bacterium]|nr:selenocysteine-specific translation elongation factor [Candidatus Latescibacterota bacterium]
MAHTVIGTAGHIDHGKTLLVQALTGTQTDRAPQEKARGITIELGFAFFGDQATIIDVPGHERFVKTMVAGVSTIDLALLVIAADDGVMPQSREHVDVLRLLGVRRGIIVLNKIDLAEEDWADLVEEEVRDLVEGCFLEEAPIVRVSALNGTGIDQLKQLLGQMIEDTEAKTGQGPFRLPVDRTFLVKGFGMVSTGTVLAGRLDEGETVDILPAGRQLRVRGLQRHGETVQAIEAGERAALNLPGIDIDDVERGDVLASPGYFKPSYMVDARLDLLASSPKALLHRARIRVHIGTREALARVYLLDREVLEPGESALVQVRLETPVVAVWGDRFVIRRYSPPLTIGGGRILDPQPVKYRRSNSAYIERLQGLEGARPEQVLAAKLLSGRGGLRAAVDLAGELGLELARTEALLGELERDGQAVLLTADNRLHAVHRSLWDDLGQRIEVGLEEYHGQFPLRPGPNREELKNRCVRQLAAPLYEHLLQGLEKAGRIVMEGAVVRLVGHSIQFSADEETIKEQIETRLKQADWADMPDGEKLAQQLEADRKQIDAMLRALQDLGSVIPLEGGLVVHIEVLDAVREKLRAKLEESGAISVADFRDLIGSNRKYALALLGFFDSQGFTQRRENVRVLRT